MEKISPKDLLAFNDFENTHPLRVDLVYAQKDHQENFLKEAIYRSDAKMWGHKDLVHIVLRAAEFCWDQYGLILVIKDCLRTVDAQTLILESQAVKANPDWLEPPRLIAMPGGGGHPRGMAVDLTLADEQGVQLDMGTHFDELSPDWRHINPSARDYKKFPQHVLKNRQILVDVMHSATDAAGRELIPLPQEWWDFRFPNTYSALYAPIYDADLPTHMRMTSL